MYNDFSALILDYRLPAKDRVDILREIKVSNPHPVIIFFTADGMESSRQKVMEAEADAYLVKPNNLTNVVPTVIKFLETNFKSILILLFKTIFDFFSPPVRNKFLH